MRDRETGGRLIVADRETWRLRSVPTLYQGTPATTSADPETVARWVSRLRAVVAADPEHVSPSYRLSKLNVSGSLAAQVLAAYEEAE